LTKRLDNTTTVVMLQSLEAQELQDMERTKLPRRMATTAALSPELR
jgi:hypothetical protein